MKARHRHVADAHHLTLLDLGLFGKQKAACRRAADNRLEGPGASGGFAGGW
jgi:hypothetical protein